MKAFIYFLFLTVAFSQTMVEGVVIDSNGLPISYVIVRDLSEDKDIDNWHITNNDGLSLIHI